MLDACCLCLFRSVTLTYVSLFGFVSCFLVLLRTLQNSGNCWLIIELQLTTSFLNIRKIMQDFETICFDMEFLRKCYYFWLIPCLLRGTISFKILAMVQWKGNLKKRVWEFFLEVALLQKNVYFLFRFNGNIILLVELRWLDLIRLASFDIVLKFK